MASIGIWISAMRLRTLPLALSTVWMGNAVVWSKLDNPYPVFIWSLITTIALQILSNFANDYGDYTNGADNEDRLGPKRAVQSGSITAGQMRIAIGIMVAICLMSGIQLLRLAFWMYEYYTAFWAMLGVGVCGILAAYFYTAGKRPYGYAGLGDLSVFLFFGMVGVMGNAFVQTRCLEWSWIFPAATVGALSCAVLNLNNMRDRDNDAAAGKNTLVVRLGLSKAKVYHSILLITAWCCTIASFQLFHFRNIALIVLIPMAIQIFRWLKVLRISEPQSLDRELKPLALTTAMIALIFFLVA
jgi:1,4-dihydroxy-2-naphthoate polyprenyltransferase